MFSPQHGGYHSFKSNWSIRDNIRGAPYQTNDPHKAGIAGAVSQIHRTSVTICPSQFGFSSASGCSERTLFLYGLLRFLGKDS